MNITYAKRTENMRSSAIRALSKFVHQPGVISFAGGSPAPESFPADGLIAANREVLSANGGIALQYSETEGLDDLRQIIIAHMEAAGIPGMKLENVIITNGSQQGLDFCGRLFLDENDVVICEDPSYLGAINAFCAYGPRFVAVPMDDEGILSDALEQALKENPKAKFIYTIPTFQNPTGRTMSQKRRREVLNLAIEYNVPIIEDDPYGCLYFDGNQTLPIKHYDAQEAVIYLGTYSKTFCPGLRIGWIAASANIIEKFGIIKQSTDLHTSTLSQMELATFIKSTDWNAHIDTIRNIYRKKRDVMMESIAMHFPQDITCTYPKGGLFTWVDLPKEVSAEDVLALSLKHKVAFVPGSPFYAGGGQHNHMRLSYGMSSEEEIRTGIQRLGCALMSFCK